MPIIIHHALLNRRVSVRKPRDFIPPLILVKLIVSKRNRV